MNAIAPKVSVAEVEIKRLGLFEQRFDVGLRVRNPNDFDLQIEALEFEMDVNGHPFATGVSSTTTLIPAVSSTLMRVDATMQSKNLIRQIKTLPPEMLLEGVPYVIKGRVKAGKWSGWLPFEHRGVYGSDEKSLKGTTI
ncbi:MAG: LEA type 2 family protein [Thiobacillus sp.]